VLDPAEHEFADDPRTLRVVLDMRIPEGTWGGVQQAAMGLAYGLSLLGAGRERYFFLAFKGESDWLRPLLKGDCELVEIETPSRHWTSLRSRLWSIGLARLARLIGRVADRDSTKVVRRLRAQIVHSTHQFAFKTTARRIYQPHDLQHLHFPQFFSREEVRRRNDLYSAHCRSSDMIAVMSRWGRADLIQQCDIDKAKVFVVPWAAPVDLYRDPTSDDLDDLRKKYELPDRYLLYPAQTLPHKNHAGLFQALKELQTRGLEDVSLVCTGQTTAHSTAIMENARLLGIADKVRFLGWIPSANMIGVYRLAHGLVYPSLFEGWGMPVMEAFRLGVPVACSRIPVLQELAGEAAIYFDPTNFDDMADAIVSLWTDRALRDRLVPSGRMRAGLIDWRTIAEVFRAHYRRLAGMPLGARDTALVELSVSAKWFK